MRTKIALAVPIISLLSGCTDTIATVFGRPQIRDDIEIPIGRNKEKVVIFSMTGERRLATVKHDDKNNEIVCGESYPDVATAYGAASKAAANASYQGLGGSVDFASGFQTALLQTFNRTETADVVRHLGWQICQAYSNGAITQLQAWSLLNDLVNKSFDTLTVVSRRHFFSVAPDWGHVTGTTMAALADLRGFVGERR